MAYCITTRLCYSTNAKLVGCSALTNESSQWKWWHQGLPSALLGQWWAACHLAQCVCTQLHELALSRWLGDPALGLQGALLGAWTGLLPVPGHEAHSVLCPSQVGQDLGCSSHQMSFSTVGQQTIFQPMYLLGEYTKILWLGSCW